MLEAALRRDRQIVIAALVLVTLAAWIWLLAGAGMESGGTAMSDMAMPEMGAPAAHSRMAAPPWDFGYALLMFFMWWIMMLAMMLPSAAPMILLFAAINRRRRQRGAPFVPTAAFAGGYLTVWAAFSLTAVVLQWALRRADLLSPMLVGTSAVLGGGLLVAAGLYQLTPLKHACLEHCRSPVHFLTGHWREGIAGALRMGMIHGSYCVGCCWFLMALLFVGGVMDLRWIIGLAFFVLLEKAMPGGHRLARAAGVVLLAAGSWRLLATGS